MSIQTEPQVVPLRKRGGLWIQADVFFSFLIMIVTVGLVLMENNLLTWLRVACGYLLSLYLPGYLLTNLVFIRKEQLEAWERNTVSLVTSVVISITILLILSMTDIRITPVSDTLTQSIITAALAVSVYVRRNMLHYYVPYVWKGAHRNFLGWGLCLLVCAGTWTFVAPNMTDTKPELWVTNLHGVLQGYPSIIPRGSAYAVEVRLKNPAGYAISGTIAEGDRYGSSEERHVIARRVIVQPGATVVQLVDLPSDTTGRHQVIFTFVIDGNKARVKQVLWLYYSVA